MQINYHKNFLKSYDKLPQKVQTRVRAIVELFNQNPFDKKLKNHALKGFMFGERAISVSGDIRIIFRQYENYTLVLLVNVGTHNQVYGG